MILESVFSLSIRKKNCRRKKRKHRKQPQKRFRFFFSCLTPLGVFLPLTVLNLPCPENFNFWTGLPRNAILKSSTQAITSYRTRLILDEILENYNFPAVRKKKKCTSRHFPYLVLFYNRAMSERRNLPIGIQTFEKIRVGNYVYVDKTQFVEKLARYKCIAELKKNYDGYHFSKDTETDVYNPFSLMNAFFNNSFGSYWFSTGTPTFLTKMMLDVQFDYESLENGIDVDSRSLEEYRLNSSEPVPMLYQTGYLTIKNYEKEFGSYTIVIPNAEVKFGLYKRLLPLYAGFPNDDKKIEIVNFLKELRAGKVNEFMERINKIFAAAPKKSNQKCYELDCQASSK